MRRSAKSSAEILLSLVLLSVHLSVSSSSPVAPEPSEEHSRYVIQVESGNVTQQLAVHRTKTSKGSRREWGTQVNKNTYFASWNGDIKKGAITVKAEKIGSTARQATVFPASKGVGALIAQPSERGRYVEFKLSSPAQLSIEFDDDPGKLEPLLLFVGDKLDGDSLKANVPATHIFTDARALAQLSNKTTAVYFGPGKKNVGFWNVPSHVQEIFIDEGSTFIGYIHAKRGDNNPLIIRGGGTISNEGFSYHFPSIANINDYESSLKWHKAIEIGGGRGHVIEGLTIVDPTSYLIQLYASDSTISNVKLLGFRLNNDAITISGKNNVIQQSFIRVNDDAVVLKDVDRLTVRGCTFWQLGDGSIFQLGWMAHDINGLTIENSDVIHADWPDDMENSGFINLMALRASSNPAVISNIVIDSIRFDTPITRFVNIMPNKMKSIDDPMLGPSAPWTFSGIKFSNIAIKSKVRNGGALIHFSGFSPTFPSKDVIFENLRIDDELVTGTSFSTNPLIRTDNIHNLRVLPQLNPGGSR